jgi:hypothetical protein
MLRSIAAHAELSRPTNDVALRCVSKHKAATSAPPSWFETARAYWRRDYELLRQNRKVAYLIEEMPVEKIERLAANKMDEGHAGLNALMDE